jgi:hypothetical protein
MECWSHHNINLDVDTVNQHLRDAWELENDKGDSKMDLQGLERQFWLGTDCSSSSSYSDAMRMRVLAAFAVPRSLQDLLLNKTLLSLN